MATPLVPDSDGSTETVIEGGTSATNISNYRIDFQNRDIHGNIMKTWVGPTQYNCAWRWSMKREINQPFYVSRGKQCARLFVGGAFRGEQCHNIF